MENSNSDSRPIRTDEDVYLLWAESNNVEIRFMSSKEHYQYEESLHMDIVKSITIIVIMAIVTMVALLFQIKFFPQSQYMSRAMHCVYGFDALTLLWFFWTVIKWHFRERLASEIVTFESDWAEFKNVFDIQSLDDFQYHACLRQHVEIKLHQAAAFNDSIGKQKLIKHEKMHKLALKFGLCKQNRFHYSS